MSVMKVDWWLVGGFVTGFVISDFWHSWWNLLLPITGMAACGVAAVVRARRGERRNRIPRVTPRIR